VLPATDEAEQEALVRVALAALDSSSPAELDDLARAVAATVLGIDEVAAQESIDAAVRAVSQPSPDVAALPAFVRHLGAVIVRARTRYAADQEIRASALHDELTGLPNRRQFSEHARTVLNRSPSTAPGPLSYALLMLDLDGFKDVNDTFGHATGDLLLQLAAERLRGCLRPRDLVARLGGDEFAVLLADVPDAAHAEQTAARLLSAVNRPFDLDGQRVYISGSIGVVPFAGETFEHILGDGDLAMYAAKSQGRNRAVVFDAALRQGVEDRLSLHRDLRSALSTNSLEVWHQPIFDLGSNQWVGAEALSRWRHPAHGFVAPDRFIRLAEEVGLIGSLGASVLHRTLSRAAQWKRSLPADHPFCSGLNTSASELTDPAFVDRVLSGCELVGLRPDSLVLEMTEGVLMQHESDERAKLAELREAGVRIAIDDFGTGYSSLSYLVRLPVDIVKLDRSFVAALGVSDREEAVIRAATRLAQDLGLILVAEGVETAEQVQRLLDLDCRLGQGFHLRRPLTAQQFGEGLQASTCRDRDQVHLEGDRRHG